MKKTFLIALWIMTALGAQAAKEEATTLSADEQAGRASALLVRADEARDAGRDQEARRYYQEALEAYTLLSQKHPEWQPGVVRFRMTYCQNQMETKQTPPPDTAPEPAPVSPPPPAKPEDVQSLVSKAKVLLGDGKPMEARVLLINALRQSPGNMEARLMLTQALCQVGLFQDALTLARGILQNNPSHVQALVLAGTAYFGLGKTAEAEAKLREALAIQPRLAEAHFNLAQVLLHGSAPDLAQVRRHYQQALEGGVQPDPRLDALMNKQP